jgi:hypothetical protein
MGDVATAGTRAPLLSVIQDLVAAAIEYHNPFAFERKRAWKRRP